MDDRPSNDKAVPPPETRDTAVLRVLHAEDNLSDVKLVRRQLEHSGFTLSVDWVTSPEEFAESLRSKPYDVVLADYRIPGWSGMEALEILQKQGKDIPFILVTGTLGEDTAVDCIKRGATDYVLKDRLARLPFAIRRALEDQKSRQARRAAEAMLRLRTQALEAAANGILITDREGRIIWVNQAFITLTGYTAAEALGQTPRILKSGQHDAAFYRNIWETVLAGGVWRGDIINRHKDGSLCVEEATITPVRDQGGEITHFIDIKQDISERRRVQEALQKSEEQLRLAQKLEAIGRLAGGVAHDFNNLLTVINGCSQLVLDEIGRESPTGQQVHEILRAGESAARLTRQLLAFSRRQVLVPKVIDLNGVINEMGRMVRRLIGEDIEVTILARANPAWIKVDPGQIEQVVMNLVVNARDAMPRGGLLTLETTNEDPLDAGRARLQDAPAALPPGPHVALTVRDNGAGMDPETQAHIFEPFFSTKEENRGTGLGLATVYGIVSQSGGQITVHSELGMGTTFKVYFPCADLGAPDHTSSGRLRVQLKSTAEAVSKGAVTVLLVEDEDGVRRMAQRVLEREGHAVLIAQRPSEALSLSQHHPGQIDLLLTDVKLPEMNGPELAERLRSLRPDMKVLLMSGYTDDSTIRQVLLKPGHYFLGKPFTPNALTESVGQILSAG